MFWKYEFCIMHLKYSDKWLSGSILSATTCLYILISQVLRKTRYNIKLKQLSENKTENPINIYIHHYTPCIFDLGKDDHCGHV